MRSLADMRCAFQSSLTSSTTTGSAGAGYPGTGLNPRTVTGQQPSTDVSSGAAASNGQPRKQTGASFKPQQYGSSQPSSQRTSDSSSTAMGFERDTANPDPNLVMSRDPRYHSSFPNVYYQPVSPDGWISVEAINNFFHSIMAKFVGKAAMEEAAKSERSTVRGVNQPGGFVATAEGDQTSVNSPENRLFKLTEPQRVALQQAERAAGLPSADVRTAVEGRHEQEQSTSNDFGQEADGTAYVGPGAGASEGTGAGIRKKGVPTRPPPTAQTGAGSVTAKARVS